MLLPYSFILCAADQTNALPSSKSEETLWQEHLIWMFLGDISQAGLDRIRKKGKGSDEADVCTRWKGISCKNQLVTSIFFNYQPIGNFNICVLPPSVVNLTIKSCQQKYEIHSRMLPRRLEGVILEQNKIFGRLDVAALPQSVIRLHLAGNSITGPIHLIDLPRMIEVIDLRQNNIKQQTVYYGKLPASLRCVLIRGGNGFLFANDISEYRALQPEHRVKDPSIFRGVSPNRIF
ncbi:leucine-rich repeat protein [Perkinsela sp. CCAP 1560/4]|nr:leucine-rich repeat protein [Perkinsela sp. CCAP 1560/4]|eukprot:KNH08532.1 leucine-rich repeat protein [Perkinsela sp. CCAP 1560/4]